MRALNAFFRLYVRLCFSTKPYWHPVHKETAIYYGVAHILFSALLIGVSFWLAKSWIDVVAGIVIAAIAYVVLRNVIWSHARD